MESYAFVMIKSERFNRIPHLAGATLFVFYLIPHLVFTLYHGLLSGHAKRVFRVFDHLAMYLLIAGSDAPFTLVALAGIVG